jgi:hypothetical protein
MHDQTSERAEPQEQEARSMEVRSGFVGLAQADRVTMISSGAGAVAAGNNVEMTSAGATMLAAGNIININSGGGMFLAAGNRISVQQGGGAVMAARHADVRRSYVGLLVAATADLKEGSRVLLTAREAAALGVALGLVLALANRLRGSR